MWTRLVRALVVSLVPAAIACSDPIGKGWDWNRMRRQPRYAPYDTSVFFANGLAMRAPPAGTIARETSMPREDSAAAMRAVERRPDDLRRGADRFGIYCAVCHGPAGDGGSVVGDNLRNPSPPSLIGARVTALSPLQLYRVITGGFGRMPAYGPSLSTADRWAVVSYVLELQHGSKSQADTAADSVP